MAVTAYLSENLFDNLRIHTMGIEYRQKIGQLKGNNMHYSQAQKYTAVY